MSELNKLEFEFAHLIRWKWGTPDSKRSESANLYGENWACPEIRTFEHQHPCTSTHCVSFSHQKKNHVAMLPTLTTKLIDNSDVLVEG